MVADMEEGNEGLELLLVLVQNTMENHWDMSRCVCIICSLGKQMDMAPHGMEDRWGKPDPSMPFHVPYLSVIEVGERRADLL